MTMAKKSIAEWSSFMLQTVSEIKFKYARCNAFGKEDSWSREGFNGRFGRKIILRSKKVVAKRRGNIKVSGS